MLTLGRERSEAGLEGWVCNFLWLAPPSLSLPASSLHPPPTSGFCPPRNPGHPSPAAFCPRVSPAPSVLGGASEEAPSLPAIRAGEPGCTRIRGGGGPAGKQP